MSFQEAYDNQLSKIDGKVTETESQWLWEHAAALRDQPNILEIGVWAGRTTCTLALATKEKNGYVVGVEQDTKRAKDSWGNAVKYCDLNARCDLELGRMYHNKDHRVNVHFIAEGSPEALTRFQDSYFDMVFIDGAHTSDRVALDIMASIRVLRRGGILCGHDYKIQGVRCMVDLMIRCIPDAFENFHAECIGSIWCATLLEKPDYDDGQINRMIDTYDSKKLGGESVARCLRTMKGRMP